MRSSPIRAVLLATVFVWSCAPTSAFATDQLTLEVTVPAPDIPSAPFRPEANAADFLGVNLGLTSADIGRILEAQGFTEGETTKRYLLSEEYHEVEIIASGPNRRVVSIFWIGPQGPDQSERIDVEFTSPLSGQHGMIVRRFVGYTRGAEPPLEMIRTAIYEKYGAPSRDDGGRRFEWNWLAGKLVPQDADDKQMVIAIKTQGPFVEQIEYQLTDGAALEADRLRMNEFEDSVATAAEQLRSAQAAKPKL